MRNARWLTISTVIAILLATVAVAILTASTSDPIPPEPMQEQILQGMALDTAAKLGLEGEPLAQRTLSMSYGEWRQLSGSPLDPRSDESPDIPVYILVVEGRIQWRGFGVPTWDEKTPDNNNCLIIVLDARTGEVMATVFGPSNDNMPISVSE
jgi:hypothetical protein